MRLISCTTSAAVPGLTELLTGRPEGRWLAIITILLFLFAAGGLNAAEQEKEIGDEEIVKAIETDLLVSTSVSAHLIDVECDKGIVTLRGSTDNLLARDQAVRIARSFKGVKSVVDLIEIRPVLISDEQLRSDVKYAIATDPATELYKVKVAVEDGVVTLTGNVDSMAERELTGAVASGVLGVREVKNEIDVYFTTERSDGEIKKEIEKRLQYNPYVYSGLIDIEVRDGEVRLSGSVGSSADRMRAYRAAWVAGVVKVDTSDLDVKWWLTNRMRRERNATDTSDDAVKEAIKRAFTYDPRILSFEIQIEVDRGVVFLGGVVDNLKAKKAALKDAENTLGVVWVDNHIKVRPQVVPIDSELEDLVEKALMRDPVLEIRDFTVIARNGKVYLYGYVDSFYERFHVDNVVSRVIGVVDVQNNVSVHYPSLYVTDEKIEREIKRKLLWSFVIDAGDMTVSVEDGIATLSGTVDDWREYKAAIDKAFEGGARRVVNHLRIAGNPDSGLPYLQMYWNSPERPF